MIYEHLASLVSSYEAVDNIMRTLEEEEALQRMEHNAANLAWNTSKTQCDLSCHKRLLCGIITSLSCGIRCAWRL